MDEKSTTVIFLAAGYGTRIARGLADNPQFSHLSNVPKPLLPLAGKPLLSHWLPHLSNISGLSNVTVITNAHYYDQYHAWSMDDEQTKSFPSPISVLSDGTKDNATRLGAVKDMQIALKHINENHPSVDVAIVIAADTLLPDVDFANDVVRPFLIRTKTEEFPLGVVSYKLSDMSDCVRRGMLKVKQEIIEAEKGQQSILIATGLVEKPSSPEIAPSPWATAPIYILRKKLWKSIDDFLEARAQDPLEKRDAPGHLLAWLLVQSEKCMMRPVPGRVDIGALSHYIDALHMYSNRNNTTKSLRAEGEVAVGRAYARIGLLGNPSDMYNGRVIGVAIESEGYAEVIASPNCSEFEISSNETLELPTSFSSADHFFETLTAFGPRYGARQIVVAATTAFLRMAKTLKFTMIKDTDFSTVKCRLSYNTSIPARVGLAGSSALALGTWRALARFFNTSLQEINPDRTIWPVLLRSIEKDDLGITCGLMDRVTQVMQGCVDMDFKNGEPGIWNHLPLSYLPTLYLVRFQDAEKQKAAQCSGDVHERARKRIRCMSDPEEYTSQIAKELAQGANQLADALTEQNEEKRATALMKLPELMNKNFELRCKLIGYDTVGNANIRIIETAREFGLAAKLCGSGGCAVCVPTPIRNLTTTEEDNMRSMFAKRDMLFRKVKPVGPLDW